MEIVPVEYNVVREHSTFLIGSYRHDGKFQWDQIRATMKRVVQGYSCILVRLTGLLVGEITVWGPGR